ncbi:hypothetical protein niasHT_025988 [Heterodera trifolii]|uniref:Uncharacterized protein n=1 Tax=Heterodera trifolii TaxID=157864 RepID=A0ABD2JA76_9BILA
MAPQLKVIVRARQLCGHSLSGAALSRASPGHRCILAGSAACDVRTTALTGEVVPSLRRRSSGGAACDVRTTTLPTSNVIGENRRTSKYYPPEITVQLTRQGIRLS